MSSIKRVVNPSTNATGIGALAAAAYAAAVMIYHVTKHTGVIDPQVIVGLLSAAWLFYTRFTVTPVKDPRTGAGEVLIPVSQARRALSGFGVGGSSAAGAGGGGAVGVPPAAGASGGTGSSGPAGMSPPSGPGGGF